jgi:hypothetical protein
VATVGSKGRHMYLKHTLPFKLRIMACFRQLHLGDSLHQHREGYSLSTTVFHAFYFPFWIGCEILGGGVISMPTTKDEIDHVKNIFCLVGYP